MDESMVMLEETKEKLNCFSSYMKAWLRQLMINLLRLPEYTQKTILYLRLGWRIFCDMDPKVGPNQTVQELSQAYPSERPLFVSDWEADTADIVSDYKEGSPESELLSSAEDGNLAAVTEILSANPDIINCRDTDGYTALHKACQGNFCDVAKYLIYNDANVAAITDQGWTPLHSAAYWDAAECVRFLLQCGADVNAKSHGGSTAIHVAAGRATGRNTLIAMLMNPSCDLTIINDAGDSVQDILRRNTKHEYLVHLGEAPFNVLKLPPSKLDLFVD